MGRPGSASLGRPGQFRSFVVISRKVFEHSCIKTDFVMPSRLTLRFLDNVLVLVIFTSFPSFTHMNIAKFARDLQMTCVKRHIQTRL